MKEINFRLLHSSKRVLLCSLTAILLATCSLGANEQEGQGSGEGWGSGRKTSQGKKPQGQDAESAEPIETRMTRLFDIYKSNKLEDEASFFVYRGEDKTRVCKD